MVLFSPKTNSARAFKKSGNTMPPKKSAAKKATAVKVRGVEKKLPAKAVAEPAPKASSSSSAR